MDNIRVLLVDDQEIVRNGLRRLLELESRMTILGEAGDGEQAVQLAASARPDVILMDIKMPVMDGVTATRAIKQSMPNIKVLMLTTYSGGYLMEAIKAGADGYLTKDISGAELVRAIDAVAGGKSMVHLAIPPEEMAELAADSDSEAARELSPRQRDVLQWVAKGSSNEDVARHLYISETTVKYELEEVMQKLGVAGRTQAVAYALEHHLV